MTVLSYAPRDDQYSDADAREIARRYVEDWGLQIVLYPKGTKGPTGKDAVGWTTQHFDYHDYDPRVHNVGVMTGVRNADGQYLLDLDFDSPEAVKLAPMILPKTGFSFGHASKSPSHFFYWVSETPSEREHKDDDGVLHFETRCLKMNGTVGLQTMVPPSIRGAKEDGEKDEPLRWITNYGISVDHENVIPRRVLLLHVGCVFLRHCGYQRWLDHKLRLSFAGYLLQRGLDAEDVVLLMTAICQLTGNAVGDEADIQNSVRSTVTRIATRAGGVSGKKELIKQLGDRGKAAVAQVDQLLAPHDFIRNQQDKPVGNSTANILKALQRLGVEMRYNELRCRVIVHWNGETRLDDDDLYDDVSVALEPLIGKVPDDALRKAISVTARGPENRFHPIKQYFDGLPKWNPSTEAPLLEEWLIRFAGAAETPYLRAISKIVLMAAVKRVLEPGCKFDEVLIMEAPQGWNKSSALKALCPRWEWFSDDLPLFVDAKQVIERTDGKWIIEAAELSGMHRSQVESLKALLSREKDNARLAYDRRATERPRQFIIVGTTNDHVYLKDKTGNRRFWPVKLGKPLDIDGLLQARDRLWAEALYRVQQGESIRLSQKLWQAAAVEQAKRGVPDGLRDLLELKYGRDTLIEVGPTLTQRLGDMEVRLCIEDVYAAVGIQPADLVRNDQLALHVTNVLTALGYTKVDRQKSPSLKNIAAGKAYGRNDDSVRQRWIRLPESQPETQMPLPEGRDA